MGAGVGSQVKGFFVAGELGLKLFILEVFFHCIAFVGGLSISASSG
jgi:hypothetical protein